MTPLILSPLLAVLMETGSVTKTGLDVPKAELSDSGFSQILNLTNLADSTDNGQEGPNPTPIPELKPLLEPKIHSAQPQLLDGLIDSTEFVASALIETRHLPPQNPIPPAPPTTYIANEITNPEILPEQPSKISNALPDEIRSVPVVAGPPSDNNFTDAVPKLVDPITAREPLVFTPSAILNPGPPTPTAEYSVPNAIEVRPEYIRPTAMPAAPAVPLAEPKGISEARSAVLSPPKAESSPILNVMQGQPQQPEKHVNFPEMTLEKPIAPDKTEIRLPELKAAVESAELFSPKQPAVPDQAMQKGLASLNFPKLADQLKMPAERSEPIPEVPANPLPEGLVRKELETPKLDVAVQPTKPIPVPIGGLRPVQPDLVVKEKAPIPELASVKAGSKAQKPPFGAAEIHNTRAGLKSETVPRDQASAPIKPGRVQESSLPAPTQLIDTISTGAGFGQNTPVIAEIAPDQVSTPFADIEGFAKVDRPIAMAKAQPDIVLSKSIAAQITRAADFGSEQAVEIRLDPAELGKVRLTLHTSDAGISVQVIAERPETMDLMRRNVGDLEVEFRGLGYQDISFEFSQNQQNQSAEASETDSEKSDNANNSSERTLKKSTQTSLNSSPTNGLDLRL